MKQETTVKHTPGPWTVINGNTFFPSVVMAKIEVPVEDVGTLNYPYPCFTVNCSHDQKSDSIMANAKLIAAAPELLKTLEKIQVAAELAIHGGATDLYKFCELVLLNTRPVIKKATE